MTFTELYGDRLDRELGSSDTRQLFTTARRKSAINDAQREWVRQTECLVRELSITLLDGVREYDLRTRTTDFWMLAKPGADLTIIETSGTRTVSGPDFPQRSEAWLDAEEPDWRNASAGTPTAWYLRHSGGQLKFRVTPAPDTATSERWTVRLYYLAQPTDMSVDADEPFEVNGESPQWLRPWHQALVHYAAAQLEKLRRDHAASDMQLQRFVTYVTDFLQRQRPKGPRTVRWARDYRGEAAGSMRSAMVGVYAPDPWRD